MKINIVRFLEIYSIAVNELKTADVNKRAGMQPGEGIINVDFCQGVLHGMNIAIEALFEEDE